MANNKTAQTTKPSKFKIHNTKITSPSKTLEYEPDLAEYFPWLKDMPEIAQYDMTQLGCNDESSSIFLGWNCCQSIAREMTDE